MGTARRRRGRDTPSVVPDDAWLASVAEAAARAARAPAELLGEYLTLLADAAISGRRPQEQDLAAVRHLGRQAAEQGVIASRAVDLYLSAAWRLWRELPAVLRTQDGTAVRAAAEAVLHVVDDAVAVLVAGHQAERRQMIRREESARREFIDDLLRGDSDVSRLIERAEPFGLDLGRSHQVVLAAPEAAAAAPENAMAMLERVIIDRFGDRDVLVASKDGRLVTLVPQATPPGLARVSEPDAGQVVHGALGRAHKSGSWRVAAGRPYPGAYGIARSYEEAREALELAARMHLQTPVVQARELLVYRVLGRDQAAITDLVLAVLGPLRQARGGAEPLLQTMQSYFDTGGVATETARRLHLSVRAVTYRLAKIKALTGYDPANPAQRFTLHTAVLGALLLGWPESLPPDG